MRASRYRTAQHRPGRGAWHPARGRRKRLGAISIFTLAQDGDFNPVAIPGSEDTFNDNSDGHVLFSGILADEFVIPGFIPSRSEWTTA